MSKRNDLIVLTFLWSLEAISFANPSDGRNQPRISQLFALMQNFVGGVKAPFEGDFLCLEAIFYHSAWKLGKNLQNKKPIKDKNSHENFLTLKISPTEKTVLKTS